jgi:hypothetical protein
MRALAPDADERFPTMQSLQIALESFAREGGLALSTVALASYVQELFADELEAWRAAQREGKSLGDHLAAKPVVVASADPSDRTATDAFATARVRAQRIARGARIAALAVFVVLCAVAGGLVTKRWSSGGVARYRDTAAASLPTAATPQPATAATIVENPRSVAPGAERNPATNPTAEKLMPSTTAPLPALGASTVKTGKTKARVKTAVLRQARAGAEGQPGGSRTTVDSRLGTWDPDSPVPP